MTTSIRPKISEKNKYYIDKHRHYELKHFCLQYPIWKKEYACADIIGPGTSSFERVSSRGLPSDPVLAALIKKEYYMEKIRLIEQAAEETDYILYKYILKAVTEGLSYNYLKTILQMPCSKDLYYDRYRKFFWILSKKRG